MPKWNMFSDEVKEEKRLITAYGGPSVVENRFCCYDTYKAQALRELSKRLLLEEELAHLRDRIDAAVDLLDGINEAELVCLTGHNPTFIRERLKRFNS